MSNQSSIPVISIIGRPNVGKSSIFNRLMGQGEKAITHNVPGVTRDRHYGMTLLNENTSIEAKEAILVDTGGFYPEKIEVVEKLGKMKDIERDEFFNLMADHAKLAIEESDLVLFVADVREGLLPFDEKIIRFLRENNTNFWLLINKYDSDSQEGTQFDFYSLGVDEENMFITSASHGLGFADLKDRLQKEALLLSESKVNLNIQLGVAPTHKVVGNLAIVGGPNAGKSTLLNRLVGKKRALVSNIAGTTVDPIEAYINLNFGKNVNQIDEHLKLGQSNNRIIGDYLSYLKEVGMEAVTKKFVDDGVLDDENEDEFFNELEESEFLENIEIEKVKDVQSSEDTLRSIKIIDTAGMRRKSLVKGTIEGQSVYRSLRCISESDIVLVMIDGEKGITHQDKRICQIAIEKGRSVIICINKFDLYKEKFQSEKEMQMWHRSLVLDNPWLKFCSFIPLSALKGQGVNKLQREIVATFYTRKTKFSTGKLNRLISDLVSSNQVHVRGKGKKEFKVRYASQLKSAPPTFLLFCNRSQNIPDHYKKYLQNGLREGLGIKNTPVHILYRTSKDLKMRLQKVTSAHDNAIGRS